MGFLAGKRALIVGLATERSIAHGIAAACTHDSTPRSVASHSPPKIPPTAVDTIEASRQRNPVAIATATSGAITTLSRRATGLTT